MTIAIEKLQEHVRKINALEIEKVQPGMPTKITEAFQEGDTVAQGDLLLIVVNKIPNGYKKSIKPSAKLVPGQTEGSRHCLNSLKGVVIYLPETWDEDSLDGPCFVAKEEKVVLHPVHGSVTVPAGFTILCAYDKEWDKEQAKERRTRD